MYRMLYILQVIPPSLVFMTFKSLYLKKKPNQHHHTITWYLQSITLFILLPACPFTGFSHHCKCCESRMLIPCLTVSRTRGESSFYVFPNSTVFTATTTQSVSEAGVKKVKSRLTKHRTGNYSKEIRGIDFNRCEQSKIHKANVIKQLGVKISHDC